MNGDKIAIICILGLVAILWIWLFVREWLLKRKGLGTPWDDNI